MKYSVFTVMAPDMPFEELCPYLKELGYDGIEVRITNQQPSEDGKPSFWSGNLATISAKNVLNEIEDFASLCKANDLEMFTLGTYLNPKTDFDEVETLMQAAKLVGCPQIRVGDGGYDRSDGAPNYRKQLADGIEMFKGVEKLAKKYKVKANLETHPNHLVVSASAHYYFVKNFDPEYIGVIYDVGNMVHEGYETWKVGLELLGEYLSFVHIKNNSKRRDGIDEDGSTIWAPDLFGGGTFRGGMVDMAAFMKILKEVGYDGWLSQEDFSKTLPTKLKLADNIEYLKLLESKA